MCNQLAPADRFAHLLNLWEQVWQIVMPNGTPPCISSLSNSRQQELLTTPARVIPLAESRAGTGQERSRSTAASAGQNPAGRPCQGGASSSANTAGGGGTGPGRLEARTLQRLPTDIRAPMLKLLGALEAFVILSTKKDKDQAMASQD